MQTITTLITFFIATLISFYSLSIKDTNGNTIAFSSFSNKKILIVNTCINCADTVQYRKLEQLYQKYKDSLVVIAVPSNSFGKTPMSNTAIRNFIQQKYNIHYILAEKMSVKGNEISPLYNWFADSTKNGIMKGKVNNDFYKFLIDKDGNLLGEFGRTTDLMGNNIKAAIEQ